MRKISVVGIGSGNPEHITMQAVRVLNQVDVIFMIDKGDATKELIETRTQICERYLDAPGPRVVTFDDPPRDRTAAEYREAVEDWRRRRADTYAELIVRELADDGHAAIMVWGDPGIYDSTVHVLDLVASRGEVAFTVDVIPGISSVQALAAGHGVSLTRTGRPVQFTPARLLDGALPAGVDDVVVMLDAGCSFTELPAETRIWWGAYAGSPDELLIAGTVGEVGDQIVAARQEARERHGWIMDSYLLRRAE
jgi:precorrin-6A synthase